MIKLGLLYLYRMKKANDEMGMSAKNLDEAIEELEDLENRSCDNCKHRVLHEYYAHEKITIDKCSIRKDLRFNGSCDGLKCNKWESK